jgi:energy-coupling factor transporter ATP-binding protein EcfA2
MADAVFGSKTSAEYFLDVDRAEDGAPVAAKPVFGGCDAHNFDQLKALGSEVEDPDRKTVTWIKADLTYEGLLQTLAEPAARVQVGATRPDRKEPYKVMTAVRFSGSDDFPAELVLNQNLVAVIGSRSSGKSALLAYIAHAVDREYSERQQLEADPAATEKSIGPAPGLTWAQVDDIECTVEWGEGITEDGRVIYIPQNSLFAISEKPEEITAKIEPTLYRLDPSFEVAHRQMTTEVDAANEEIRSAAGEWFRSAVALQAAEGERRDLGEKSAIEKTKSDLENQINTLRLDSSLSEDESQSYEELVGQLGQIEVRRREIQAETQRLAPHLVLLDDGSHAAAASVAVDLRLHPPVSELPDGLRTLIAKLVEETEQSTRSAVEQLLVSRQANLEAELGSLVQEEERLRKENESLMTKNQANEEIEALVVDKKKQDEALADFAAKDKEVEQLREALGLVIERIVGAVGRRTEAIDGLKVKFDSNERVLEGKMAFGLESKLSEKTREGISSRVNRRATTAFVDRDSGIDLAKCQAEPAEFLQAIRSGGQRVHSGQDPEEVAIDALVATPEVRFSAEMEGDRIGGFRAATMTPGKQALFALTLILNESEEAWPLLIDQPEDDLDSRSIYDVLVGYLSDRKKERQIIMVSHDANLVIGADSEQVVVANRHGDDRQNVDGQQFGYFTGSLEYSRERQDSPIAFELGGIREHACDILDGGEEAFRKRKAKYKI